MNLVLYFTETGNSLEVAKAIQNKMGDVEIKNIIDISDDIDLTNYETIGFVYPVYFIKTPKFILDKIAKLSIPKNTYYYAISTAGAMDGNSGHLLYQALEKKDAKLSYYKSVNMVDNYIIMYSAPDVQKQADKSTKAVITYNEAIDEIIAQKTVEIKKKQKLLSDVFYKMFESKKKKSQKEFHATDKCTGCGVCEKVCKFDNISIVDNMPKWNNNCEHCVACIQWCPHSAIEYGKKTASRTRYTNPNIKVNEL